MFYIQLDLIILHFSPDVPKHPDSAESRGKQVAALIVTLVHTDSYLNVNTTCMFPNSAGWKTG